MEGREEGCWLTMVILENRKGEGGVKGWAENQFVSKQEQPETTAQLPLYPSLHRQHRCHRLSNNYLHWSEHQSLDTKNTILFAEPVNRPEQRPIPPTTTKRGYWLLDGFHLPLPPCVFVDMADGTRSGVGKASRNHHLVSQPLFASRAPCRQTNVL